MYICNICNIHLYTYIYECVYTCIYIYKTCRGGERRAQTARPSARKPSAAAPSCPTARTETASGAAGHSPPPCPRRAGTWPNACPQRPPPAPAHSHLYCPPLFLPGERYCGSRVKVSASARLGLHHSLLFLPGGRYCGLIVTGSARHQHQRARILTVLLFFFQGNNTAG